VVIALLAGCSSFLGSTHNGSGSGSDCSGPPPPGSCDCSNGTWWCSTCPFGEGPGPVPCTQSGASCQIETWEHGCDCSCANGWWGCSRETIGSICPSGPPDAGIDTPPPDASIDAAPCSTIEAENVGNHTGWDLLTGANCTTYPSDPSCLQNGLGMAGTPASALDFYFTGTTLAIRYEIGPNTGQMQVAIDGAAPVAINVYQPGAFTMNTLALASGLANAQHHVVVTCVSGDCSVDDFPVTCQ